SHSRSGNLAHPPGKLHPTPGLRVLTSHTALLTQYIFALLSAPPCTSSNRPLMQCTAPNQRSGHYWPRLPQPVTMTRFLHSRASPAVFAPFLIPPPLHPLPPMSPIQASRGTAQE